MAGITLVGLGSGEPSEITLEVQDTLLATAELWVTSVDHPVLAALPRSVSLCVLGATESTDTTDTDGDPGTVAQLLNLSLRPQGVVLALPGHPLISSALGRALWSAAAASGASRRVISAPSPVDAVLGALPLASYLKLFVCSADSLAKAHIPPFPPDVPALITGVATLKARRSVQTLLQTAYPPEHPVELFILAPRPRQSSLPLRSLANVVADAADASLYVPALEAGASLEALQEVVAHLRAPEGCPWDRKQTHASLRPHLLEESYEAMQAMDSGDASALREELGDLLLQIMLNSQIAAEAGAFTLNDVTLGIHDKLIRRHPHVFGELKLADVDGVLSNWERLKEGERAEKGAAAGLLEGVPRALPALSQAQEYQDRAARVGFDWPQIAGVLEKLAEEIREVQAAADVQALEAELGDLFFSLVNLARWKGVDAESALRASNQRFRRRLRFIETAAEGQGRRLSELTLDEMEAFWDQAKASDLSPSEDH